MTMKQLATDRDAMPIGRMPFGQTMFGRTTFGPKMPKQCLVEQCLNKKLFHRTTFGFIKLLLGHLFTPKGYPVACKPQLAFTVGPPSAVLGRP
jgi:hypothetical protein